MTQSRTNLVSETKKLVMAALCVALGVILPIVLHSIPNAGSTILPMHLPVLLCGLLCGWQYGMLCGFLAPLLSSLITGMPGAAYLPAMLCELPTYGMAAGALYQLIRTKKEIVNIYISLVGAMLIGRIVYGIVSALVFKAGEYSMQMWMTSMFVTGIIGIVIQLAVIPAIVYALKKAKVIS